MARLMSTGRTFKSAAIAAAAVAMMVPSRISMKNVPATKSAEARLKELLPTEASRLIPTAYAVANEGPHASGASHRGFGELTAGGALRRRTCFDGEMSLLIVLRGNSGSGKSTVACALQRELDGVWIEQDNFRRTILGEDGNYSALSIVLIQQSAALALQHGRTVIMEGMFNANTYSAAFASLRGGHQGRSLFYAYDLSLEETLRRHTTRPDKRADFGEEAMRGWYRGWNPLTGLAEVKITEQESAAETIKRILNDVRGG